MQNDRLNAIVPVSPKSLEMRQIARKWERFVVGQDVDLSDIPSFVRDAWVRSKQAGVDPAAPHAPWEAIPTDPEELRQQIDWLPCAEPVLSLLRSILTESHQFMALTDQHGSLLFTHGGVRALDQAERLRAVPGGKFGEADIGSNGTGTSLYTDTPLQVSWQEHYCLSCQDWVAQAAPIHHPWTRETLGAIFTAGYLELSHPKALGLVINAAAMIEAGIREQEAQARFAVLEYLTRMAARYPADGLVAIDKRGCILAVNPAAEHILSLPYATAVGRRVHELPSLRDYFGQLTTTTPTLSGFSYELLRGATLFPVSIEHAVGAVVLLPSRSARKEPAPHSWPAAYTFTDLIGQTPQFRECIDLAQQASRHDWPVLLSGESGTGKELFAQAIHNASPCKSGPFVTFSCASISDDLIGTELFGYTEGAFTGAVKGGKTGKIQLAHTGTLFLDDIDGMPYKMQLSLLRVLEDQRVVPLGAQKPQPINIRVIAASNGNLEQAIREGKFRHDLYHRLNVLPIQLPPLRERIADIPPLARHILSRHVPSVSVTAEAQHLLAQYAWPGNVRELRNVLITAATRIQSGCITPSDLPVALRCSDSPIFTTSTSTLPLPSLRTTEEELIVRTLQQTQSISEAAAVLGIHFSTLYRKLKKYGIAVPVERG